jgi:hypothetical protein
LERNFNSPIAQEEYLLEELENLYPSRPYNQKRKPSRATSQSNAASSSNSSNRPTTSRQSALNNLQDLELTRIEDILEKELENDDDASRAKRGKGLAEKSRLLDNMLSKYFH